MDRLSRPLSELTPRYDAVVIGSGYGGAIAACRLAQDDRRVCLLERGVELHPGDYPDTMRSALPLMQARFFTERGRLHHIGPPTGLFDVRIGRGLHALVGCGLGGTSLINANVALRADHAVFSAHPWPEELTADDRLGSGYELAEHMLGVATNQRLLSSGKVGALTASFALPSAQPSGQPGRVRLAPLTVTFEAGPPNPAGVQQNPCTGCGNCVTGCNDGSKNTTLMNYLPLAVQHQAEVFTSAAVDHVERHGDEWVVLFRDLSGRTGTRDRLGRLLSVRAPIVVLSAGTYGSTEILLRSRETGLRFSPQLGRRVTGNGDVLGFAYDGTTGVNAVGSRPGVGPTIAAYLDHRQDPDPMHRMLVEDGSIPRALSGFVMPMLLLSSLVGEPLPSDGSRLRSWINRLPGRLARTFQGGQRTPVARTLTFLAMSMDDDQGELNLVDGHACLTWPHAARGRIFKGDNDGLAGAAHALGATYVADPLWKVGFNRSLVTVHPLGGCVMAATVDEGVVDHRCQVLDPTGGVHDGLYVMDGSVVATPLGVNPLLTISALSERACRLLVERGKR
jgi:cholesterol oxidase